MLYHESIEKADSSPEQWLYTLHGIFGAGRNWASLMRRLVGERPDWGAILVDLREHGNSQGFPPPHTLEATAADLVELVEGTGHQATAILGHSFGGKVALLYGTEHPGQVDEIWVIDSTPEARAPRGGAFRMLELIREFPDPLPSRQMLIEGLVAAGVEPGIAQWMGTNLVLREGEYYWRIEFDTMQALLEDFYRTDLWPIVEAPSGPRIHFVKATRGSVLSDEATARIEDASAANGRVFLHHVEGGHWLNADNPDALIELLEEELGSGAVR